MLITEKELNEIRNEREGHWYFGCDNEIEEDVGRFWSDNLCYHYLTDNDLLTVIGSKILQNKCITETKKETLENKAFEAMHQ